MDKSTHAFLLASENDRIKFGFGKDKEELVRGCDVLPSVLGPLMGGEEYDIDVGHHTRLSLSVILMLMSGL